MGTAPLCWEAAGHVNFPPTSWTGIVVDKSCIESTLPTLKTSWEHAVSSPSTHARIQEHSFLIVDEDMKEEDLLPVTTKLGTVTRTLSGRSFPLALSSTNLPHYHSALCQAGLCVQAHVLLLSYPGRSDPTM